MYKQIFIIVDALIKLQGLQWTLDKFADTPVIYNYLKNKVLILHLYF